jgi:hypothetical protein
VRFAEAALVARLAAVLQSDAVSGVEVRVRPAGR